MFQEQLQNLLNYDPDTGVFTWRDDLPVKRGPRVAGKRAGSRNAEGYLYVEINRRKYKTSRLAFLWMTGEWPTFCVDHINRDRSDDRWCNLRDVTRSENRINYKRAGYPEPPDLSAQFPAAFAQTQP